MTIFKPVPIYQWEVHWQGRQFIFQAHDWEPDEHGVSFMGAPLDDSLAEITHFFSHPVAILRGELVQ